MRPKGSSAAAVDPMIEKHFPSAARITRNILARKAVLGLSVPDMCTATGMTAPTLYNRIRDPRLWTVGDIIRLSVLLKITPLELVGDDLASTEKERKRYNDRIEREYQQADRPFGRKNT